MFYYSFNLELSCPISYLRIWPYIFPVFLLKMFSIGFSFLTLYFGMFPSAFSFWEQTTINVPLSPQNSPSGVHNRTWTGLKCHITDCFSLQIPLSSYLWTCMGTRLYCKLEVSIPLLPPLLSRQEFRGWQAPKKNYPLRMRNSACDCWRYTCRKMCVVIQAAGRVRIPETPCMHSHFQERPVF